MEYPFGTITINPKAKQLIDYALETTNLTQGRLVRKFEEKFAETVGVKEAVAVSSGTEADILALASLYDRGAKRGNEVILPALTFVATANSVVHAGFKPVFIDINKDTLNLDVNKIEEKITPETIAILPVHLLGKPVEMDKVMAIAKKHNLYVIEDAAEAHGAKYKGKNAGSIGNLGAFSLYAAHIISSIEGGIITTNDSDLAEAARSLRSHGRNCVCKSCVMSLGAVTCEKRFAKGHDQRFTFDRIGYSCKMNELEAAIGLGTMEFYQEVVGKRKFNLDYLIRNFGQFSPILSTFSEESHESIGPHAFPIIINEQAGFSREDYTDYLRQNRIDTRDLFASIPTQYASFAYLGHQLGDFPNAEFIGENGIHIGVHQDLTQAHLDYFLEKTEEFLKTR